LDTLFREGTSARSGFATVSLKELVLVLVIMDSDEEWQDDAASLCPSLASDISLEIDDDMAGFVDPVELAGAFYTLLSSAARSGLPCDNLLSPALLLPRPCTD